MIPTSPAPSILLPASPGFRVSVLPVRGDSIRVRIVRREVV